MPAASSGGAIVVKAVVPGWLSHPRRVSFPDPALLANAFALQPGSFRLAYRDDDNDLIELATAADLHECIDFFSFGGSNASSSAFPSTSASLAAVPAASITLRIEILVEYDGPALSEAGTGTGTGRGLSSAHSRNGGPATSVSRAETTISSAATDREGALARWKAEQDALAAQFSRLGARGPRGTTHLVPDDERIASEEAMHRAARDAEERNRDRRLWMIEQEAITVQLARAGLDPGGGGASGTSRQQQQHATRRRYSGNDVSSGDEWVRDRAFDLSRGLRQGEGGTEENGGREGEVLPAVDDVEDDDDWDRETVSSFVPFGGASRFPPADEDGGVGDHHFGAALGPRDDEALHPNFASHFIVTQPIQQQPYSTDREQAGPSLPLPAWDSSPMFSSPGSSMYSLGNGQGEADSSYGPTRSERARVEALFAPSEYGSSAYSNGQNGATTSEADYNAAAADSAAVWGGDNPPHDSFARSASGITSQEQAATPPAGQVSTLVTASTTLVNGEDSPQDFTCAVCMDAIDGVRYLCVQCEGYNLCETCEDDPGAKAASRRRKNSSAFDSALSTIGRTRRQNEYIPMLHDPNHVLLKIRPGATLPRTLGGIASVGSASGSSSNGTPPAQPPPPIAPPAPPLSIPSTPLPYLGRTREFVPRLPADGPTRLTRPDPPRHASEGSASTSSSSTAPARAHLVPPIHIPARSIPGFSVLGATVAPVQLPEINIPAVDFPSIQYPVLSLAPRSAPSAAPTEPSTASSAPQVAQFALQPPSFRRFDNVIERNHGVGCSHCGQLIPTGPGEAGVRWLCGNCPTVPGYNLCSDCEQDSASIHDPSHAFLRLTHRLQRPLPSLSSGLVPLLYLPKPDGEEHANEARSVVTRPEDRVEGGKHPTVVCDACGQKITDSWMLCCHCPVSFDLCRPCLVERDASTLARHNPSHVFLELKDSVDLDLLKQVTRFSSRRPRGLIEWDLYS
ncbi:hypothetical protein JCM10908_001905 [Rhodotorula pacifica]|uniref:uncharacterized protein n=1 Tax=Rhodotorula pacifica TaxID=1495444 RepID=UPI00316EE77E